MAQKVAKAKYWTAVLYPESMVEDWESKISDLVQIPFEYCIHDKDSNKAIKEYKSKYGETVVYEWTEKHDERKIHVHVILAFSNTTTYNHALSIFQKLMPSCKYCEQVLNIRYLHEYLIHNTETAKKQNKHQYDVKERISGNNFDIGSYEQLSITDKRNMLKELCDFIVEYEIYNFFDFYIHVSDRFSPEYFEVIASYSGMLERLCKGVFLKLHS